MSNANPRITIIAAISKNRGLGKNNQLLWHIPKDLSFFKKTTLGNPIIMGNNTYASIGHPLPNRLNIVVSATLIELGIQIEGCEVVSSLNEAITLATRHLSLRTKHSAELTGESKNETVLLFKRQLSEHKEPSEYTLQPDIFIIGGAQIYARALQQNMVDRVLLTEINQFADADVFFPVLDEQVWQEVGRESHVDEEHGFSFDFVDYQKRT